MPGHPGDLEDPTRPIIALAVDHPGPHRFRPHCHYRAQLVYASAGVITVATATGTWVVPPQEAVWVPAGVEHEVRSAASLTCVPLPPATVPGEGRGGSVRVGQWT